MKILHIVAGMTPESGVAAVVTRLAVEQQGLGCEVSVAFTSNNCLIASLPYCLIDKTLNCVSEEQVRGVTFRRCWPHFLYFSWGMLWGLGKMVKDADVVHVHSNWTFPVWWGAWLALRHQKTLVMSPHGCLDPVRLKHSGWKKRLVGWIDRGLLRRASVVHATCEEEAGWIQPVLKFESSKVEGAEDCRDSKWGGEVLKFESSKVLINELNEFNELRQCQDSLKKLV